MNPLTDRQERFIHEYLIDHNASAAAVRAGYSAKTKGTQAAELMKDARVQARIAMEMGELFARLKVSAFELLRKQVCALNFDPAKLFDAQGGPVALADLDEETKAALSVTFEDRRGERVMKVRQTPRHIALAALWRRFDAFQKVQARALEVLAVKEEEQAREEAREEAWQEARREEEQAAEIARNAPPVPRQPIDLTQTPVGQMFQRLDAQARAYREEREAQEAQAKRGGQGGEVPAGPGGEAIQQDPAARARALREQAWQEEARQAQIEREKERLASLWSRVPNAPGFQQRVEEAVRAIRAGSAPGRAG
jgi:phage terminase small subunit